MPPRRTSIQLLGKDFLQDLIFFMCWFVFQVSWSLLCCSLQFLFWNHPPYFSELSLFLAGEWANADFAFVLFSRNTSQRCMNDVMWIGEDQSYHTNQKNGSIPDLLSATYCSLCLGFCSTLTTSLACALPDSSWWWKGKSTNSCQTMVAPYNKIYDLVLHWAIGDGFFIVDQVHLAFNFTC